MTLTLPLTVSEPASALSEACVGDSGMVLVHTGKMVGSGRTTQDSERPRLVAVRYFRVELRSLVYWLDYLVVVASLQVIDGTLKPPKPPNIRSIQHILIEDGCNLLA